MIGKIKSYDSETQTGVIKSEEGHYEFHIHDWSEGTAKPPLLESDVLFEVEGDSAVMVTLIGSYLIPKEAVKSRSVAMWLALFPLTGLFGAHRWYLGFYKLGALQLLVTAVTVGFGILWPIVEAFLLYTGRFDKDAQGRPLK